jgi:hypothetical protein
LSENKSVAMPTWNSFVDSVTAGVNFGVDSNVLRADQNTAKYTVTRLRPALSATIKSFSITNNHADYLIWVCDVQSGAEWSVSRRFREFNELHEVCY